ncbi:MAG: class I SAM-dependent methyltransferase [Microcoleaceae cyanobacterium]
MNNYPKLSKPCNCVVCDSPFVAYIRDIPTRRTRKDIPLYYCMECESLFNPSGYKEDDRILKKDLEWNIGVIERNLETSEKLIKELIKLYPSAKSVLEIGCGIGTNLSVASKYFSKVTGYDLNHYAVDYGKDRFGLDLKSEMWISSKTQSYDIVLCIMVLEHLENPRHLFSQLVEATKNGKGALFISVPFLERNRWKYILEPDPYVKGTPFFDNDVHVTHFSQKGLTELAKQHGATSINRISQGWLGYIFEFT